MKKVLAGCAIAAAAVFGVAAPAHAATPDDIIEGTDPALNKPSYWAALPPAGDFCAKIEFANGPTSGVLPTLASYDFTKLILKAGTQYTVFDYPDEGATYGPANGKQISFAIY